MRRVDSFRVARLDELDRISVAGVTWRPVRRRLRTRAFGVNAYSADDGEHLIEPHDETGPGAGRHEELYVVIAGRARFTVAGEEVDAPAGTFVFIRDPTVTRHAVAREDGSTVLAVGGRPGEPFRESGWEYSFAAQPHVDAGDYVRAVEVASEGLPRHADDAGLLYNIACWEALAGRREDALAHLREAYELEPGKVREWARDDRDLDSLRTAFPWE